jgi:hypothetical protein
MNVLDMQDGVKNLLLNCAEARSGEKVLIVGETAEHSYFEAGICDDVAAIAESQGLKTEIVLAQPVSRAEDISVKLNKAMKSADRIVFFSRLGDQFRFSEIPGSAAKVVSTTLTRKHLGSSFSKTDHKVTERILGRLMDEILKANSYSLQADCGTHLICEDLNISGKARDRITDFTVKYFPTMIFPPVDCGNMHGELVLKDFLMSTSTRAFEDSVLLLDSPVTATIRDSIIVNLKGDPGLVSKIEAQLYRASKLTDGEPFRINSWHTGVNPNTFFDGDPFSDIERWGIVSYGSPRYTHFHLAGNDPGDVSVQLFDATIAFDGVTFWDRGRFIFLDRPDIQKLLSENNIGHFSSSQMLDIGV